MRKAPSSRSTARPFPRRCSRRSCSVTRRARLPAPPRASRVASRWRIGGRCSSTRSATCRSALQAKILRALEEKRFERVGGTSSLHVDTRVVAATNRNLKAARRRPPVSGGPVFPAVGVPDHDSAASRADRRHPDSGASLRRTVLPRSHKADADAVAGGARRATRLRWPGNVRELQNCIERAVILCDAESIQPRHLNLSFRRKRKQRANHRKLRQPARIPGADRSVGHDERRGASGSPRRSSVESWNGAEGGRRQQGARGRSAAGQLQGVAAEAEGIRNRRDLGTRPADEVSRCASRVAGRRRWSADGPDRSQSVSGSRMSDHRQHRSAATRPWRLRGVPTPNSVRISSPRFNAAGGAARV